MKTDRYGNPLNTGSQAARDAYVRGVDCILAAQPGGAAAFAESIAADPGFSLGYAGLARVRSLALDTSGANTALETAERTSSDTRARSHIAALGLLIRQGGGVQTLTAMRTHLEIWPRDAIIAQTCTNIFGLIGFSGAAGREAEMLSFTSMLLPNYGDDWWMMSMHALSLCETGQLGRAATLMDRALELNPDNANAVHFKAHAHYEAGETDAGRRYLSAWMDGYDRRGALHGHLVWHLGLWALSTGDEQAMWRAYDEGIAPGASESTPLNVLTDSASLLFRAGLAGIDVPQARWKVLSDYAAARFALPGQSFADMHSALAHAMAGEADALLPLLGQPAGFAGDMVAAVAAAWQAIAAQDFGSAIEHLVPVVARSERIGGSRAQRDLLEFAMFGALLRLGRGEEAARLLRLRRPEIGPAPIAGLEQGAP